MNIKEIKEIIELMKDNNINEFEMERDGLKIALKRGPTGVFEQQVAQVIPHAAVSAPPPQEHPKAVEEAPKQNITHITSPMVGTFYSAQSPDSEPYVAVGADVKDADVVCVIEAMKVMNEIKAETRGRVKEIFVKNGEAVEFGQPLFVIEKN